MPAAQRVPSSRSPTPEFALVPCLLLRAGQVMVPGERGPTVARTTEGKPIDPFDVVDRLPPKSQLYVVDLDGVERGDPQVEYLQELARDLELWVDAGVRTADQSIDIFVAGATRVVLSSVQLHGPDELDRAWKLSPSILFEVEWGDAGLSPIHPDWESQDVRGLVARVREVAPIDLILSPRDTSVDWALVRELSSGGTTYLDGSFDRSDAERLRAAGGRVGIYHWTEEELRANSA
ncbi:MAG: HisA/HisF-related TIM barrel protein [Thermoplasmata archaeon]